MEPPSSTPSHTSPSNEPVQAPPQKDVVEHPTSPQQSNAVSISQTSQEMNQYIEAMTNLPEIRQERIAQIQIAMQKGSYVISSEDLADKLIQELSGKPPSSPS